MVLYIKNMVCNRCKLMVKQEIERLQLHPTSVELGEVILEEKKLSQNQATELEQRLQALGFELIDDRKSRTIEKIKNAVIDLVHYSDQQLNVNNSDYLSDKLHQDYSSLSKLFSEVEGMTIEQYIIRQKIERVKELLVYDELSLSEIADRMGYSSTAHLSAQFKKVTGLTPSFYKHMPAHNRKPLDEIGE